MAPEMLFPPSDREHLEGVMRWAAVVVISVSLAACSSTSATSSDSRALKASPARNVITATEIVRSRVSDVYQAVTQLRPDFLRRRSSSATMTTMKANAVVVYLDEMPLGGEESLRAIPLERVRVIRFLSPFDADLRWGGSHPAGAILVTTLKR
jgi:hypothetical protein